jgi:hypothetical protein
VAKALKNLALRPYPGPRPALAILLIVIAGACPKKPTVTDIEIVPSAVVVGSDLTSATSFELEARLWTGPATSRLSITESQGYDNLTWTPSQPWLKLVSHSGFRATFRIEAGPGPTTSANLTVKAGGKTSIPAEISVAPNVVPSQDFLSATYTANMVPDAAIVNGIRNAVGAPCSLSLSAFVTRTELGKVVDLCGGWGAAVLAVDHQMMFTPVGWSPGQDVVNAGALQGPLVSLPLALRVMVGNSSLSPADLAKLQDDALKVAQADIAAANSILAETRAGIKLVVDNSDKIGPLEEVISDCLPGDGLTSAHDTPGMLNVYYVNSLDEFRGRTCGWHESRPQDVIYVAWDKHSPTTFIHEVGHALGLTLPGQGHSDIVAGFDLTNVMTSGENDLDPGGRFRFSVGQVFRMNADSASWLNWAHDALGNPVRGAGEPLLACQCGESDPTERCPRLVDDVARPSAGPGSAQTWDCYDQVRLTTVNDVAESPVGIVAGRRGRAPPGTCSTDLPGSAELRWGVTFVRFENLTRPGTCDSWAAIFFRRHGLLFLRLGEPEFVLSQVANELRVTDPMPDRVNVKVHVFYSNPAVLQPTVDKDVDHALKTFGESNRSGILLVFDMNTTDPCPDTAPGLLEINLCYPSPGSNVGTSEASLSPVRIRVLNRTETTVSHFLGRALGLKVLASKDPRFPDNIMQQVPADRGQKLTLGQVFRINAALIPGLPKCDPGPCPSLSADVPP